MTLTRKWNDAYHKEGATAERLVTERGTHEEVTTTAALTFGQRERGVCKLNSLYHMHYVTITFSTSRVREREREKRESEGKREIYRGRRREREAVTAMMYSLLGVRAAR